MIDNNKVKRVYDEYRLVKQECDEVLKEAIHAKWQDHSDSDLAEAWGMETYKIRDIRKRYGLKRTRKSSAELSKMNLYKRN